MKQIPTEFFSITEIGGVGEMIYKAVRFPECVPEYDHERKEDTIVPICTYLHRPESGTDYSITGQELLVSLCNLYKKINAPDYSVGITDMVWDWCRNNIQPYNIEILCQMMEQENYGEYLLSGEITSYGTFDVSDFVKDLCKLGSAYEYYDVLMKVRYNHDVAAGRALYYEGRICDSMPFLEKFRRFDNDEQYLCEFNTLYRDALKAKLYILDEDELAKSYVVDTKKFSLSKLKYAVQKLEGLSFVDGKNSFSGKDILGDFFEGIIRNGFKQSKGQFFTHINIVRFMLWAIQADRLAVSRIKNDKEIPYMIDPSAGSGTFLIEYMKFITENMKYRFRNELGSARAVKDKIESDWFYPDHRENKWAQTYIYASESNFNLGTATKVNMILHGDGSTNIFVKDGLLPFTYYQKETAPNVMHDSTDEPLYFDKAINGNFDLILTNPPFSVELDNDTKKSIKKSFVFGEKKNSENLFIERWYQLLRENGRLAAVLPESVFDTTENKYIRLFLYKYFKIKAVVSLPQLAFEPYTSTKTSLLFAQKKTTAEVEKWNKAWDEASKEYSKLKTRVENLIAVHDGIKEKKKLPSIKELTADEERAIICRMLKSYITQKDDSLSADKLINKYRAELTDLCSVDKDTVDSFGHVNTWWVFGEVAKHFNYDVFMAEVDSIGYKRTKRGEKEMPNELFELEYAPLKLDASLVEKDYQTAIDAVCLEITTISGKKAKEKKADKIAQLDAKLNELNDKKSKLEAEFTEIKGFIDKYYAAGTLKAEYNERTDAALISEFKNGRLQKYRSEAVALHESTYNTVLDYMRKLDWE